VSGNPGSDIPEGVSPHVLDPEGMGNCGLLRGPAKIPLTFGKFNPRCPGLRKRAGDESNRYKEKTGFKSHLTSLIY